MDTLKDITVYLIAGTEKRELSNARVTKMVYLADWRNVILEGRQITTIEWYFDTYGPFVWDVNKIAEAHPDLFVTKIVAGVNGVKHRDIALRSSAYVAEVSDNTKTVLDHVLEATKSLKWDKFVKLVYSTYPIAKSEQHTTLDLVSLGSEYHELNWDEQ